MHAVAAMPAYLRRRRRVTQQMAQLQQMLLPTFAALATDWMVAFRRSQKRNIAPGVCVIVTDRLRVVFICDPRCSCPVACPVPCQVTCGRSRAVGGRGFAVSVLVASAGAVCADARQEHVSRQLNCVGRRRERRVRRAGEATRHVTQVARCLAVYRVSRFFEQLYHILYRPG